jgi:hypothetical protein
VNAKEGNQGFPRYARLANHAKEGNQGFPP